MKFKKSVCLLLTTSLILCNVINIFGYPWDTKTLIVNEEPVYTEFPDYYSEDKSEDPTAGLADEYNRNNAEMHKKPLAKSKPENQREFVVVDFTKNQARYKINANLTYEGENCIIYVGDDSMNKLDKLKLAYEKIDKNMLPFVNNNFTKPTDVDNNGKVIILLYDIKDNYSNGGGFTAGYFNSADLYRVENSNAGEVLYVDTYPTEIWGNDYKGSTTVVHEYQHLVQHNSKIPKDTWMNEGMSMLAEQLYQGKALDSRITSGLQYYGAYRGTPLMSWNRNGSSVFANYALSYTFFAYMYGQLGKDFIKEYYNSPEHDFRAFVPSIEKRLNMDIGEFMTNYYLALTLNKPSGVHSFNYPGFNELYKNPGDGGVDYESLLPSASGYGRIPLQIQNKTRDDVRVIKINNNSIYKPEVKVTELIGVDRYDTNNKVNNANGDDENLILVDYKNPIYGLISSPLANQYNADIMLYDNRKVEDINKIIDEKGYKNITVIGDISCDIKHAYDRISGKNVTEISKNISNKIQTDEKVILVNGDNNGQVDALSASAPAGEFKIPVISVSKNMDQSTINKINSFKEIIVIGGNNTVTNEMLKGIDNNKVIRLSGNDRYETNAKVINHFYKRGADNIIVSKGWELIDSSISGTLADEKYAPIVLMNKNGINNLQKRFLSYLSYTNVYIVGGGLDNNHVNNQIIRH